MSAWRNGLMALFDIESTGVDPHRDRIVTAAVVAVGGGRDTRVSEWLVNPGIPIPAGATAVHGITDEQVQASGCDLDFTAYEIAAALLDAAKNSIPIVGHNIAYDLTMLHAHLLRADAKGHESPAKRGNPGALAHALTRIRPVVDTIVLDKHLDPYRPKQPTARRPNPEKCGSRTLIDTCRIYGVPLTDADAHGATADALAAGRLAWKLAGDPKLPADLHELHDFQVDAKAAQAESLEQWFRKQGKSDTVSRSWPIQDLPHGWSPDQLPTPAEEEEAVA